MAVERQSSALPPAQPSYILRGHTSQIHSVQFARKNTRLITGDADGWVIYWKLETKRALAVWKAHDGAILGTAEWAYDKVITHGRDNNLRIWQIRAADEATLSTALPSDDVSRDRSMPWLLHTLPVNTLNFCAFSMCYASQEQTHDYESTNEVTDHARSQASVLIAVPARDDKKAEVYQFPAERLKYVVPRAQSKDTGMVMAIKLIQTAVSQQTLVITGYEGGLTAVHVLPQDDNSVIGVAQLVYLSQPHTQPVLSLDVSPDATTYFTSGADAVIAAHRIPELPPSGGNERLPSSTSDDPPVSIPAQDYAPAIGALTDTSTVSSPSDEPADDPPISIPDDAGLEPMSFTKRLVPNPSSSRSNIRTGGLTSLLSNTPNLQKTANASPPPLPIPSIQIPYKVNNTKHAGQQSLVVRPDNRLLATGGWDARIRIYSAKTLKEVAVLKWHKQGVYSVAFAAILDAAELRNDVAEDMTESGVTKRETGLSRLQKQREEKMQSKHWVVAGAKDGKVSLWEVF